MTLDDRQLLALLCAAPVDGGAHGGGGVRVGHVTGHEHWAAERHLQGHADDLLSPMEARAILARVHGLPEHAPADVESSVMSRAWESDARDQDEDTAALIERGIAEANRIAIALDSCDAARGRSVDRIEALCAEVLALRARLAG